MTDSRPAEGLPERPPNDFELKIYRRAGLPESEAIEWWEAGIWPYQAEGYRSAGLEFEVALVWRQAHIGGSTAARYIAAGVSLEVAQQWHQAGFSPAEVLSAWDAGLSLSDAERRRSDERTAQGQVRKEEQLAAKLEARRAEEEEFALFERREAWAEDLRAAVADGWDFEDGKLRGYTTIDGEDSEGVADCIPLFLRVRYDDEGTIIWDVSMSEEDTGFGDACLASDSARSVEQAILDCENAAAKLKIES